MANFFVNNGTGNDSTGTGSVLNPWKTVNKAVSTVAQGSVIIVAPGDYTTNVGGLGHEFITAPSHYNPNNNPGVYTTVKGDPANGARPRFIGATPVASQYYRLFQGVGNTCAYFRMEYLEAFNLGKGVDLVEGGVPQSAPNGTYPHHIQLVNSIIHDTYAQGWQSADDHTIPYGSNNMLIEFNEFYLIGAWQPNYMPGMNCIYHPGSDSLVQNNYIHDTMCAIGIWTSGTLIRNVIVRNNYIFRNGRPDINTWINPGASSGATIHVSVGGGGHKIYNNILHDCGIASMAQSSGININVGGNNAGTFVYNNVIYNCYQGCVRGDSTPFRNNLVYLSGGVPSGFADNMTSDPLFVNPGAADFHLQPGSQAIQTGSNLYSQGIVDDYAGTPRPSSGNWEKGVYVFGGGGDTTPPAPPGNVLIG